MSDGNRQIKDSRLFEFNATIGVAVFPICVGDENRSWTLNVKSVRNHSDAENDYLEMHLTNEKHRFSMKQWQCLLCLVNEDPSKNVQKLDMNCEEKEVRYEKFMRLDEILAENSGFLIDGKLRVRVEIRVLALFDPSTGLSMFNFYEPFENCLTIDTSHELLYVNKQVMMTHCGALRSEIMAGDTEFYLPIYSDCFSVYYVLSWIHGVRSDRRYLEKYFLVYEKLMFDVAETWGILGFQRYRPVKLVNLSSQWDFYESGLMKQRLKTIHGGKELQEQTIKWQLEKLSWKSESLNEETMKAIVEKFFSLENDWGLSPHVSNAWDLQKRMEKWKRSLVSMICKQNVLKM